VFTSRDTACRRAAKLMALQVTGSIAATALAVPTTSAIVPERPPVPSCAVPFIALSPMRAPSEINLITVDELWHTEVEYPHHVYWIDLRGPAASGSPVRSMDVLPHGFDLSIGKLPGPIDTTVWGQLDSRTTPTIRSRDRRHQGNGKVRGPQRAGPSCRRYPRRK